jgi:hypothetical protein
VKYTETREGKASTSPKKKDYVSQGGVPVTRGRPSAARLLLLCAVSPNAINIHARPRVDLSTKEPHRRDKSRSPPSLLFTFLAHLYLHDNCFCAPTHVSQYCASACRSFICRRSAATLHYAPLRPTCAITCNFRNTFTFTQHLIQIAGSHTFSLQLAPLAVDPGTDNRQIANTNARHAKEGPRPDTGTGPTTREAREGQ